MKVTDECGIALFSLRIGLKRISYAYRELQSKGYFNHKRHIGGSRGGAALLNIVKSKTDKDSKLLYLFDYCVCIC